MLKLSILLILILSASGSIWAQFPSNLLKQIRQIKVLESNRDDVRRILVDYESNIDDSDHNQLFSNDDVEVLVYYSSGACSEDSNDDDDSTVWKVKEWKVTKIEISPNEAIKIKDIGVDLSKFKKEPRYPDDPDSFVFYDKVVGLAFKTTEDGIEKIILFPSRDKTPQLCKANKAVKGFYERNGWFSLDRPYDFACVLQNLPANVVEVNLNVVEIEASSGAEILVTTIAVDPENDVLTYNYKISGGEIRGQGAKVVWDLSNATPGTYTITVGVDDGAGVVGKTISRTATVK